MSFRKETKIKVLENLGYNNKKKIKTLLLDFFMIDFLFVVCILISL